MKNNDLIKILNELKITMRNMKSSIDNMVRWIDLIIENKNTTNKW
tara:strand:+ start:147 stop:281 length:135 start_codon:yes stop_codon:yes gene_type:complete